MDSLRTSIDGVNLTPLRIIDAPGGAVLHGMKKGESGFLGFGEAYFSTVEQGAIKAWKRHRTMTLNLIVPIGAVQFAIYDDRADSMTNGKLFSIQLSKEEYFRLTVPPMVWVGFAGVGELNNMILNIADIIHDPDEIDRKETNEIKFKWGLV